MNPYIEAMRPKLSEADLQKLLAIKIHKVHEFIAKSADLCNAENIFICSDSAEDIAYVRQQSIANGEENVFSNIFSVMVFLLFL